MTNEQKLESIRQACIKANPDVYSPTGLEPLLEGRPIRLADVLLAIGNMLTIVDCDGNFYQMKMKLSDKEPKFEKHLGKWNLRIDDLTQQSEAFIDFLHSLLS